MHKVLTGFTAAIYNYLYHQQYKAAASAPRLVDKLCTESCMGIMHSKYFKCISLPSDLLYLTSVFQPVANFSFHLCTIYCVQARMF